MFRKNNPGQAQGSGFGHTVFWVIVIGIAVYMFPDLGAQHAKAQQGITSGAALPGDEHNLFGEGNDSLRTTRDITWTVFLHRGYNPDWQCWMLRLTKPSTGDDTTSDFCAKDKADYDSHPDGATYITHGGWLDNTLRDGENLQPTDHT
jgi:hypothetical protein